MASSSSSSSSSEPGKNWESDSSYVEWETDGYWEPRETPRPEAFRFIFREVRESSAPYLHIKRIRLYGNDDPTFFKFTAHCTATLKKSARQEAGAAQSPTEGKYRPNRLGEEEVTRTKWAAVRPEPGSPIHMELRPAEGTHFPNLASYQFVNGIRTSRYPMSWTLQQKVMGEWQDLHKCDNTSSSFVEQSRIELPEEAKSSSSFAGSQKLVETIASGDVDKVVAAFNHSLGPSYKRGVCVNLDALLLASLKSSNASRLFPLVYLHATTLSSEVEKAVFATGNVDLIALAVQTRSAKRHLKQGVASRNPDLLNFVFNLYKDEVSDYEDKLVCWGVQFGQLNEVLAKLQQADGTAPAPESLPKHQLFEKPTARLLLAAYRGDPALFEILFSLTPVSQISAFLAAANRPGKKRDVSVDIFQKAFRRAVSLTDKSDDGDTLLDRALKNKDNELANFLLEHGARSSQGNDAALLEAYNEGNFETVEVLIAHGTPAPYFHLFNLLINHEKLKAPQKEAALSLLFKPGRLSPSAVTPAGTTLAQRAVAKGDFTLVSQLLAHGASATMPDGRSLFAAAVSTTKDPEALLGLLGTRTPEDGPHVTTALFIYLEHRTDNEPANIRKFLEAGADINAKDANNRTVLELLVSQSFDKDLFRALIDLGADVSKSSNLSLAAARNPVIDGEAFDFLATFQPIDAGQVIFSLIADRSDILLDKPESVSILDKVLANNPDLSNSYKISLSKNIKCHEGVLTHMPRRRAHCDKCKRNVNTGAVLWSNTTTNADFCTDCASAENPVEADPNTTEEIPLIVLAALLQTDNRLFFRLADQGARIKTFEHPKAALLTATAFARVLWLDPSKEQLPVAKITQAIETLTTPSVPREVFFLTGLFPAIGYPFADTPFTRFPVTLLEEELEREDFDANYTVAFPSREDDVAHFLSAAIKANAPAALIEKLLTQGADPSAAEEYVVEASSKRVGSLVCLAIKNIISAGDSEKITALPELVKKLLSNGATLTALDSDNLPVPHSVAWLSGKTSGTEPRRAIKQIFKNFLEAGLDINVPITNFSDIKADLSSYCNFNGATPMDFNYAGNEYLQRFFRKRNGVRGTR